MISLQNVSKSFNGHRAVDDLSFTVQPGEIMGLLGANGAGKSTTINMLLGFLPPDAGSVKINGLETTREARQVRKLIGYIPENVQLYPHLSGLENLDYFCRMAGEQYPKSVLAETLSLCGLQASAHQQRVSEYSKGMRQKVGIAIAYAKQAKVYLLDEPASGLDPLASYELSQLLRRLAEEGATILMATHDIFRAREVCHRIGILKQGDLVEAIDSSSVTAQELEQLYLKFMTQ